MRYVILKKIILKLLKHPKMKRIIKRESALKYESQQTFNIGPQQTHETHEPQ